MLHFVTCDTGHILQDSFERYLPRNRKHITIAYGQYDLLGTATWARLKRYVLLFWYLLNE